MEFLSYLSCTPLERLRSALNGRDSCILQIRRIGHQLLEKSTDESVISIEKSIQTIIDQRVVLMVNLILRYGSSLLGYKEQIENHAFVYKSSDECIYHVDLLYRM